MFEDYKMLALIEKGRTDFFRRKITKIFSDIDALAVSMSEKLLRFAEGIQLAVGMHAFLSKSASPPFSARM